MKRDQMLAVLAPWLLVQVCLVVSGPLSVRLLGVSGRGELAAANSIVLLCGQAALLGLPAAIVHLGARAGVDRAGLARALRGATVQQAFVGGLVAAVVAVVLLGEQDPLAWSLLVGFGTAVVIAARIGLAHVQAAGRTIAFGLAIAVPAATYSALLVVLLLLEFDRPVVAFAAWAAGWVFAVILGVRWGPRRPPTDGRATTPVDVSAVRGYGRRSAVASALPTDQFGVDQMLVAAVAGHAVLGIYAIGLSFETVPYLLAQFAAGAAAPHVAAAEPERAREVARHWMLRGSAVVLLAGCALALITPWLLPLAFGAEAEGAIPTALVLTGAGVLLGLRTLAAALLQALGAGAATSRAEMLAFVTMVVALPISVATGGAVAAGCALAGAGAVCLLTQAVQARRLPASPTARPKPLTEDVA